MRVMYPGPKDAVIVDDVEIKRGEEAELTQAQFKRVEELGVVRAGDAAAAPAEARTRDKGDEVNTNG